MGWGDRDDNVGMWYQIKWDYKILKILVSFSPLVLASFATLFAWLRRRLPSGRLGLTRCIPCTCIETPPRLFFWHSPSKWADLWDLSWLLDILPSSQFCSLRKFWEHCRRSQWAQGTTKWNRVYFFAGIDERGRLDHRKDDKKNIAIRVGKWP